MSSAWFKIQKIDPQGNDPFIAPDWQDQSNRHSADDDCRRISGTREKRRNKWRRPA
jgi:hypothetical protein